MLLEDAETGFTNAPEEEEHDERSDANARREACRAVIFAQIVSKAACIKVCFGKKNLMRKIVFNLHHKVVFVLTKKNYE